MSSLLYISIAYYIQKGEEGVQIACKNAYVIIGRPLYQTICVRVFIRETARNQQNLSAQ